MAWVLNMADMGCSGWEIIQADSVWGSWTHSQLHWRFFIVIIYISGCLDGREISLQEKDFLVYQLCYEISSLLGNSAASALFPHEWAMSEVTAFNFCSKFDVSRKSQPAVKHNCLKITLSGEAGNPFWSCMTLQTKEGLYGYGCSKGVHVLRLTGWNWFLRFVHCSKLEGVLQLVQKLVVMSNVTTGITREALSVQHIYCCCLQLLF